VLFLLFRSLLNPGSSLSFFSSSLVVWSKRICFSSVINLDLKKLSNSPVLFRYFLCSLIDSKSFSVPFLPVARVKITGDSHRLWLSSPEWVLRFFRLYSRSWLSFLSTLFITYMSAISGIGIKFF